MENEWLGIFTKYYNTLFSVIVFILKKYKNTLTYGISFLFLYNFIVYWFGLLSTVSPKWDSFAFCFASSYLILNVSGSAKNLCHKMSFSRSRLVSILCNMWIINKCHTCDVRELNILMAIPFVLWTDSWSSLYLLAHLERSRIFPRTLNLFRTKLAWS